MTLKVLTLVGTRPEFIKLARVIAELDKHLSHTLVHSGQNFDYELNGAIFGDLQIRRPDHFLESAGGSPAETISRVIERLDKVLQIERPDAFLLLGDTNSCLGAISAKRRKIPIFHMEAGNRCFDQRVPEEINRKIVDHISDVNLTYTEHARRYLLAEGLRPDLTIKTGSPMKEVLTYYRDAIMRSDILSRYGLEEGRYFVVSAHREENVDVPERLENLMTALKGVVDTYSLPVIFSTHPRTQKRILESSAIEADNRVQFCKPLGFFDYIKLQQHAACVISDSGTLTEESSILGFPAVTVRNAHERPEGMDEGTIIMCALTTEDVLRAVHLVMQHRREDFVPKLVADYDAPSVSRKVLRIIVSYTSYVRHVVWRE